MVWLSTIGSPLRLPSNTLPCIAYDMSEGVTSSTEAAPSCYFPLRQLPVGLYADSPSVMVLLFQSRPAAPPPVPKYAVDGSKLDNRTAAGGGSCSPKEIGVVMAEAVSEATLKQVLSEAAEGKTDDDLFRALTTANADGPVSLRSSPVTTSTAIAILEACAIKRVRSFPDLARVSAILLRPGNPRITAEEATSLLRFYTFMGSINEPLALACANNVIPLLPQMSWHDIAAAARDMARHRTCATVITCATGHVRILSSILY
ncbi:hypothetical protein FOZ60_011565 [Perkinsus olseni]|uniref:Uncharacterized protein n=1 Tax=Perkinsus olseni TaxID=32597 RepID=A0A7J6ND29_PEROL|nr:hypothetical protein FOZ60_011565 [Perkinsus olseni]